MTTPAQRCEAYRRARMALVKYWIDLGRLSIHVSETTMYVRGVLAKLPGTNSELTPQVVGDIFNELKRVPGIKRVNPGLENWAQEGPGGPWHEVTILAGDPDRIPTAAQFKTWILKKKEETSSDASAADTKA